MSFNFHFTKRAKAPLRYQIGRHLGELLDGITGLLMIPFGRYGTSFAYDFNVRSLRWQIKDRKLRERK